MNRDPSPPAPEAVREEGEPEDHVLGGRPRSPAGWRKGAAATGGSGKRRAWALTSCPPPAGFAAGRKDPPGPIVSIFPGWRAQLETGTDHVPIVPAGKQLADFAPAVAALRSLMALKTILAPEGADRPCFPLKWAPSRGQDSRAGLCSCLGGRVSPRPGCSAFHSDWDVYQELCLEPTARRCRECGQTPVTGPGHLKASAALCQQRWLRQVLSGLFRVLGSGLSLTTAHCSSRHSHPTVIPSRS